MLNKTVKLIYRSGKTISSRKRGNKKKHDPQGKLDSIEGKWDKICNNIVGLIFTAPTHGNFEKNTYEGEENQVKIRCKLTIEIG